MKNSRLHFLMQCYFSDKLTREEKEELALLMSKTHKNEIKDELFQEWTETSVGEDLSVVDSQDILNNILSDKKNLKQTQRRKITRPVYLRTISVAASLLIIISVGVYLKKGSTSSDPVIAKAIPVSPDQATSYIRNLTLPDGTSVILKAGSTLHFPKQFAEKSREVILKGEAYFDVKHMNSKPFIIHTGIVKTTVLGTAFDIKAWPGQKNVVVSVTRGKVRVEDDKKVLAVLVKNEQLKYNGSEVFEVLKMVGTEKIVTDWTKEDMVFDHVTLGSIAQVLGSRYQVNITITNPQLAKAEIVSAFSGTESLQDVMEVICAINPNTHFNMKGKEIIISNN